MSYHFVPETFPSYFPSVCALKLPASFRRGFSPTSLNPPPPPPRVLLASLLSPPSPSRAPIIYQACLFTSSHFVRLAALNCLQICLIKVLPSRRGRLASPPTPYNKMEKTFSNLNHREESERNMLSHQTKERGRINKNSTRTGENKISSLGEILYFISK